MLALDTPVAVVTDSDFLNAFARLDGGAVGVHNSRSAAGTVATFVRCRFDNVSTHLVRRLPASRVRAELAKRGAAAIR